ncbi:hypothetical protein P3S67_009112 [Capsicum chacoense]
MGRPFILEYDEIQATDCIFCRRYEIRVAFIENILTLLPSLVLQWVLVLHGIFHNPYHEVIDGQTRADVYCVKCGNQLGWKLIAVTQPSRFL